LASDPVGGLIHLRDEIINDPIEFPTAWFKGNKDQRRIPLSNKINVVISLFQGAEGEPDPDLQDQLYQDAIDKLSNIRAKTNGCAESGSPDNNDWVDDCEGQALLYPIIQDLILSIQARI